MVAHGTPCLGPITQAGCGAICPAFGRGRYGCFGPVAAPNLVARPGAHVLLDRDADLIGTLHPGRSVNSIASAAARPRPDR